MTRTLFCSPNARRYWELTTDGSGCWRASSLRQSLTRAIPEAESKAVDPTGKSHNVEEAKAGTLGQPSLVVGCTCEPWVLFEIPSL